MAKIALRVYINEITDLIDHGQIDEAIAHCRHILETFSKHVDSYRLLGKGYLEEQRYGDAADILQRVLSSVPDDFIAHVGMSIIREDEGNQDAAIYHMERAFEVQPSNHAIQNELRRLYGKREGIPPTKVRLTRGALARMYAHGNLYEQAIAELLAALSEDPQRHDLHVLLANMYFQSDKKVEAAETCSKIIEKLPYCQEANRILATILMETDREEDAKIFLERWRDLDPYAAHLDDSTTSTEFVSDQAVTITRHEWEPSGYGDISPGQPAWASSLGVSIDEKKETGEGVPDWLSQAEEESEPSSFVVPGSGLEPVSDWMAADDDEDSSDGLFADQIQLDETPEWMTEAEASDEAASFLPPAEEESTVDWMSEFSDSEADSPSQAERDQQPDWLAAAEDETKDEAFPQEETGEQPDWLAAAAEEITAEPTPQPAGDEESMDWLGAISEEAAAEAAGAPQAEEPAADDDWPASLGDTGAEPALEPAEDEESMDWLSSISEEAAAEAAGDDDWLASLGDTGAELAPESGGANDETMDWLNDFSKEVAPETSEVSPVEDSSDDDWLASLGESSAEPTPEPAGDEESMDWLEDISQEAAAEAASTNETSSSEDLIPEFLKEAGWEPGIGEEGPPSFPSEPIPDEDIAKGEMPRWMKDLAPTEDELAAGISPSRDTDSFGESVKTEPDPDWLKSIDEEKSTDTPDWLSELNGEETSIPATGAPTAEHEDDTEDMGWLTGLSEKEVQEGGLDFDSLTAIGENETESDLDQLLGIESAPTDSDEDDGLAWLEGLAAKQGIAEEELVTSPEERTEETPDWLDQPVDPSAQVTDQDMDWLESITEGTPQEPDAEEPPQVPETTSEADEDAGLAWLEGLAAKQGIAEEELVTSPEERTEDVPEWIEQSIEETSRVSDAAGVSKPTSAEKPTESLFDSPDNWLDSLDDEEISQEEVEEEEPIIGELDDDMDDFLASLDSGEAPSVPSAPSSLPSGPTQEIEEDAGLAWLETLAAKQGIAEEELVTSPDERSEEPPEWVLQTSEEAPEEDILQPIDEDETTQGDEEEMDWLDSISEEAAQEAIASEPPAEDFQEEPAPSPVPEPVDEDEEEMDWLDSISEEAAEEAAAGEEMNTGELLASLAQEELQITPAAEAPTDEEEDDTAEFLASLRGVQEDETSTIVLEKEKQDESRVPEWLQDVTEEEPKSEEDEQEAPEWLPPIEEPLVDADIDVQPTQPEDWQPEAEIKPEPKAPTKKKTPAKKLEDSEALEAAREALQDSDLEDAAEIYGKLIKRGKLVEEIIKDIKEALRRHPVDPGLWQTLGDAYTRENLLKEALDSYTKAEELLR